MSAPALKTALDRILRSITTLPSRQAWGFCVIAFLIYVAITLPLGLESGTLHFELSNDHSSRLLTFAAIALFVPCLSEELCFRALLLPDPRLSLSWRYKLVRAIVAVVAFVLWHPINGLLLKTAARQTFLGPGFLLLTALLGSCCTMLYMKTASIWPSTIVHWFTVVSWKAFLGGRIF